MINDADFRPLLDFIRNSNLPKYGLQSQETDLIYVRGIIQAAMRAREEGENEIRIGMNRDGGPSESLMNEIDRRGYLVEIDNSNTGAEIIISKI